MAVEKVHFLQNSEKLEDRECTGKRRTSFVGHPDAILFLPISREGVFQQPRDFSPTIAAGSKSKLSPRPFPLPPIVSTYDSLRNVEPVIEPHNRALRPLLRYINYNVGSTIPCELSDQGSHFDEDALRYFLLLLWCGLVANGCQLTFTFISVEGGSFKVDEFYTLIAIHGREMD